MSILSLITGSSGPDLLVSPSVGGNSTWNFASQGNFVISTAGTYTITVTNTYNRSVKMWGGGGGTACLGAT